MPRKNLSPHKARAALLAIKLEKARYEIRALRRAEREAEAARALRRATPDWVEMDKTLKQIELEAEMNAMEAAIDARRPKTPILNFDLMPGFEPPAKYLSGEHSPAKRSLKEHPDVAEQRRITALEAQIANENHRPPPGEKAWKYESDIEGYDPADDWRNYE